MNAYFDHERLRVYGQSIKFVLWATDLLERIPKHLSVWDQLERAASSIPLNIAEGNGKFTAPDRCSSFDNARGSALECAACLDVLSARRHANDSQCLDGKESLRGIVSMLVGLIRSNSPDRLHEGEVEYRFDELKAAEAKPDVFCFDHEKLKVYQKSLTFIRSTAEFLEAPPRNLPVWSKLDRASTAIPLGLAEGNGKFTPADRCRFFDRARSSAFECAAALDILFAKNQIGEREANAGKVSLQEVVSMLVGLIRSNSPDRIHEESAPYSLCPGKRD
ncbi:MAG TPA: four helix bundle protein [Candidatus Binatia bacterium]|jgi:four helix bundle protein|nr:four helix bundle protein [Candidatus Binatia bacterium]